MICPAGTDRRPRNRPRRAAGMTLIEIALAVAIALLIAGISIPAAGGWIEEHNLRSALDRISTEVMRARLDAEVTGEARLLYFGAEQPAGQIHRGSTTVAVSAGNRLLVQNAEGKWEPTGELPFRIYPGGVVSAYRFRLERGKRWIVFRFDPLTGHLQEEEFFL